jgi:hypothetical protein
MKKIILGLCAIASLASCSPAPKPVVPEDWRSGATSDPLDPVVSARVENQVSRLLELNTQAAEAGGASLFASKQGAVPWHLEYFMTDLSVSASGVLGALISKGTPGVSFIWRRQYDKAQAHNPSPGNTPAADFEIVSGRSAEDVSVQLEPVIHSLVKAGIPEDKVRPELEKFAEHFVKVTSALERTGGGPWWASRFRMDLIVEASGAVTPMLTAGGEIRLRFEWHRIMPKMELAKGTGPKGDIEEFVEKLAEDVGSSALDANELADAGFEPYQFRVGVGYTEKGSIGIAKEQGTILGQLYFSADVKKPTVHPSPSPLAKEDGSEFKKGLDRAFKIAAVFARGARKAEARSKPSRHWKVYEMRAAFDISLTEKLGLAEVGGVGTAEVNFYNENF